MMISSHTGNSSDAGHHKSIFSLILSAVITSDERIWMSYERIERYKYKLNLHVAITSTWVHFKCNRFHLIYAYMITLKHRVKSLGTDL